MLPITGPKGRLSFEGMVADGGNATRGDTMSGWTQPPDAAGNPAGGDDSWLCRPAFSDGSLRAGAARAWSGGGAAPARADKSQLLFRTVETEVIPRLMLLHRDAGRQPKPSVARQPVRIEEQEVVALCELSLQAQEPAHAFVVALLERGAALEVIYLNLLAAVARRLGDLWTDDRCTFTDVTIALGRLQRIALDLANDRRLPHSERGAGRRALLVPAPGEQHTFGLSLVCEYFRSSGWEVWSDSTTVHEALSKLVRDHWFDVVGFSVGVDQRVEPLAELIRSIRKISRNRAVRVLAGGPLLVTRPEAVAQLGVDASAADARQAMLAAERLVAMRDEGR
jgi:methanogenic corrinoid protein MtbC1